MAKATLNKTKQPKLVEKVTEVQEVTLTLSQNEAEAIMSLLWRTGGEVNNSPRKHLERVRIALQGVGIRFPAWVNRRDGQEYARGDGYTFNGDYPFAPEELA